MNFLVSLLDKARNLYNNFVAPSYTDLENTFVSVVKALEQTPMKGSYWICGGVLLGYARGGCLLKYDTDIDFHYWKEDKDKMEETWEILPKFGFKQSKISRNNNGEPTQYIFKNGRVKIEFFLAWREAEKISWYCYTTKHINRPSRQFLNQIPDLKISEVKWYGVLVRKPVDHDLYLTSLYGDWRVPAKGYFYYFDSKAIVACEPWRNEK
ncbi:MAG: hypothetical protein FWG81_06485 [Betaproteobacteria bacterium]|nr:hypothetical protein [Betaproteobacteria bacterium]